jgi:hypothetical protein
LDFWGRTVLGTALATRSETDTGLPALVDRAAKALAGARSAAEVLEARDMASAAYSAQQKQNRLNKAKGAHDELIAAGHRVQADALEIEAKAKRRLADEYDAAQARGEIAKGRPKSIPEQNTFQPTAKDISPKFTAEIHEARIIRDAEEASPGVVREALDQALKSGEEPTKARVRRAVLKVAKKKKPNRKPKHQPPQESQHDRDLRMLLGVWEATCESARKEFLKTVTENLNG